MTQKKETKTKSSYTKTRSYQKRAEKSKQYALKVLKETFGNVSLTCEKVGMSRMTFYKWRSEDPVFNQAVEDINERTLDFVESKLLQGIQDGNAKLIMFYLMNRGRGRGYAQKPDDAIRKPLTVMISADEAEF